MGLEQYIKKRDFKNTPEPGGEYDRGNRLRFVIQRHQASRLHYDLRLEMEGVLKSWAVPKGPSMNPKDKRLAIETEDHPVKYLHFQGTIPKGNYGAGVMDIWDSGTYRIEEKDKGDSPVSQWKKGDMKIIFSGSKIKGQFALVKTNRGEKQNQWLLIKKKDEFSTDLEYDAEIFIGQRSSSKDGSGRETKIRKIEPGIFVKPMLASPAKKIFNDPGYIYELKWDGYRMLCNVKKGKAELYSRNGYSYNSKFGILKDELESLPHDCILDGEVVVLEKDGTPNFQKLQNYSAKTQGTLRYYVFDILYLNGHNTTELPLLDRKSLLPELLEDLENVVYSDHVKGMGTALYNKAIKAGLEGVMAKEAKSTYSPGFRTEKWLKVKESSTEDALICGYSDSLKGGGKFGSLILGMYQEGSLVYVGNCGTGFSNKEQTRLLSKLKTLERDDSPFGKKINLKGRKPHWTEPVLVCEVKFSEWTSSGLMRHPVYMGLREDKDAEEVQGTTPANNTKDKKSGTLEIDGLQVPVSNLEKVYWPGEGYTKYDLIDYYIQVSETILPYLKDRPQNLHRHPNGIDKPSFYQKDNEHLPSWVRTFTVYSESSKKEIDYLLCQDEATLVYMANLGCIELNPWNSTIEKPEHPTYTVIDIDPSSGNSFEEVIEVAQVAKEVLDTAGIPGYCKTSGSSGLHIYIPLEQKYSYEEARDFTKLLCYYIHDKLPKLTSLERAVKKRKNKIYLDYLQNRKSQTLAAPYCVRPRPGAPVSMPLDWKEVKSGLEILDFTIDNTAGRIKIKGDLFKAVLGKGIDMEKAIDHLSG